MIVTTIYRIFFQSNEVELQMKFERDHPMYMKIGEDTTGTTYEYRTDYVVNTEERIEE